MTIEERSKIIKQKHHQQCDSCFKFQIGVCCGIQYYLGGVGGQICPEGKKIYDSIPKVDEVKNGND